MSHRVLDPNIRQFNALSSAARSVAKVEPLEPRHLLAATVPGLIQAEAFDSTGYADSTAANLGGAYRNTSVDVGSNGAASGGYHVGWIQAGEKLSYSVKSSAGGAYKLQLSVAADRGYGGKFHVEVAGKNVTGQMTFPTTSGWQKYVTVTSNALQLKPGTSVLQVVFDSAARRGRDIGNFDTLKVVSVEPTAPGGSSGGSGGGSTGGSTGSIAGLSFNDNNDNGRYDSGDAPTGGKTVWIDLDRDGKIDAAEPQTRTNSNGTWSFSGLGAGTYRVARVYPAGYQMSGGGSGHLDVTLSAGQNVTGLAFGSTYATDSGNGPIKTPSPSPTPSPAPTPSPTGLAWPTSWKRAADSPINRFESHGLSYGGKLYVFGGWANSKFQSTSRVDVFDPAKNKWTRLADMKAPETHAATALDERNGVIYFVGGHRGDYPSVASSEVWTYTIATDGWKKIDVNLPQVLGGHTAQILNNKLYTFGGSGEDRYSNPGAAYVLDLSKTSAGFKRIADLPSPRDHLASFVANGRIYALGGEFGHDKLHEQQSLLHAYDPAANTWTRLADAPIQKSHAESSLTELNGKIIWAGGQIEPQKATANVVQYDPATNKWVTLKDLPASRQGTIVQKVGDYMVITTGGINTNQPQKATWVAKL